MNQTFQNSAQVVSIGVFFSLMIIGLSATLPAALSGGLVTHGVAAGDAARLSHLPPISILFAAFLGYNPLKHLLGPHVFSAISLHNQALLAGRSFFPHLISSAFRDGLHEAFAFAIVVCLIAAGASLMRGGRYHYADEPPAGPADQPAPDRLTRTGSARAAQPVA